MVRALVFQSEGQRFETLSSSANFSVSLGLSSSLSGRQIHTQISISAFPNYLCQEVKLTTQPLLQSRGGGPSSTPYVIRGCPGLSIKSNGGMWRKSTAPFSSLKPAPSPSSGQRRRRNRRALKGSQLGITSSLKRRRGREETRTNNKKPKEERRRTGSRIGHAQKKKQGARVPGQDRQ